MTRLQVSLLLQLALLLAAICAGSAISCHRSLCLDEANITACITNHTAELVDCSDLADGLNETENATACVKYSVTGATYRRIAGKSFNPCESLEVRTCFQYYSDGGLDLGGRLQEALRYAGVNETVLDVHLCHTDACNAASWPSFSTTALLAGAVLAVVCQRARNS